MILTLTILVTALLYLAALGWRIGHSGKHGQRIWSAPRPSRLLHQGAHAKPHKPAPEPASEATELAVAA